VTAEIVNLRKARKAKARSEAESRAAENRVRFGRTRAERETLAVEQDRAVRSLEGHRREARADEAPEGEGR
jgi:hypothetical protein